MQQPTIRTFLLAELKCYLCGTHAGSIERERGSTSERTIQPGRLRCPRCNGSVYVDSVEVVARRFEPIDWEDDGPRRGRPPKWLVEQRRRKRERDRTGQVA
ncbi:MAG: hypothetical protein M3336_17400 [Chloroflexota bacterium]|nr:hypothetical protein [Chloroflexota bacterium]